MRPGLLYQNVSKSAFSGNTKTVEDEADDHKWRSFREPQRKAMFSSQFLLTSVEWSFRGIQHKSFMNILHCKEAHASTRPALLRLRPSVSLQILPSISRYTRHTSQQMAEVHRASHIIAIVSSPMLPAHLLLSNHNH